MPVKKTRFAYETHADEFVSPIVAELNADRETGEAGAPEVYEEYHAFSPKFSTRVVWDRWKDVPPEDRVPLVIRAYELSRRSEEVHDLTAAIGLTRSEHALLEDLETYRAAYRRDSDSALARNK